MAGQEFVTLIITITLVKEDVEEVQQYLEEAFNAMPDLLYSTEVGPAKPEDATEFMETYGDLEEEDDD